MRPFAKEEDIRLKAVMAFVYLQLSGHTRMQCLVFVDTSKKSLTYRSGFSIHIFVKLFLSVTIVCSGAPWKNQMTVGAGGLLPNLQSGGAS